jgi:hypothetical protein
MRCENNSEMFISFDFSKSFIASFVFYISSILYRQVDVVSVIRGQLLLD